MGASGNAGERTLELPKVLTKEEAAALLAAPNLNCPTGLRDRCILQLMYRSGLRVTETVLFGPRDINWVDQLLRLRAEITKGAKEAVVPFDDPTGALLERWKFERRRAGVAGAETFFATLRGTPVSRQSVWSMMQRRARRADIDRDRIYPHMLRHTFATELIGEGVDLRVVQELLRHSDIRTTQIYTHIAPTHLADVVRRRAA